MCSHAMWGWQSRVETVGKKLVLSETEEVEQRSLLVTVAMAKENII